MAGGKVQKKRHRHPWHGGVPFEKSMGHNILKNPMLMETIIKKSDIKPTDVVLVIGPGTGSLINKLLEVAKSVVAIEIDPGMGLELNRQFMGTPFASRLTVIQGDVLKCDLPCFDICVANIPYQISYPLTSKLLTHRPPFRRAIIMLQRDFAMRLVANPGDRLYSRLSLNTQLLAHVSNLLKVGRSNFSPPPKVDSCVVRIEPRKPLPPVSLKEWNRLIHLCFTQKNKTLGSIFRQKSLLLLLEKNYKAQQALELSGKGEMEKDKEDNVAVLTQMLEDLSMEVDARKDDEEMELGDADVERGDEGSAFKERVLEVLRLGDFAEKRPWELTLVDFVYLLTRFNKAGIHFS